MLKTNIDRLVRISVQGCVSPPTYWPQGRVGIDGRTFMLPNTGGITYNVRIGDPACGWAADHVEPGVSTKNANSSENTLYNELACIGNEMQVLSGDAKGARGLVTGTHGGIEHVIGWFSPTALEQLAVGDVIQIRAFGKGLCLTDYPDVRFLSIDPGLLDKLSVEEKDGRLLVPAAKRIPARLMGSGVGATSTDSGDCDVTLFDEKTVRDYDLDGLRLGDLVFIEDFDSSYGYSFVQGAATVGVIAHTDSRLMGHGPGVTPLFTCKKPLLAPRVDPNANLARYFEIDGR
ncbi:MAG: DUF4438 domain-containing protein [Oscillospiraceae bacterium]|nr:DUF4438 domain-containing protein [Oscillospiraceae bacterium]